ncbi:MAG: hypothetical protein KAG53_12045 [Endozoicomonadaceae bacterium]|nr:hypothetical protein [Endozoicomonadaceae bacterium]
MFLKRVIFHKCTGHELGSAGLQCFALLGQKTLLGADSPVRHMTKRRRLKMVMQKLIDQAVQLVKSSRQYILRFARESLRVFSRAP